MSKILIVGAGQAGLQLALGLVQDGHDVTVVSNRTPEDIHDGKVMSSQFMFDAALQHERDLGINYWEEECPDTEGVSLAVPAPPGVETPTGKVIDWAQAWMLPERAEITGNQRISIANRKSKMIAETKTAMWLIRELITAS